MTMLFLVVACIAVGVFLGVMYVHADAEIDPVQQRLTVMFGGPAAEPRRCKKCGQSESCDSPYCGFTLENAE